MQNRPQLEAKLAARPSIQFCQLIEAIIVEVKLPIQKECFFFSDGLNDARNDYRMLVGAYRKVKKMIYNYEEAREEMGMPSDLAAILEKAEAESKSLGEEVGNFQREFEQKKGELQAQEKGIRERLDAALDLQRKEEEKRQRESSDGFMRAQLERNNLEQEQKKIGDTMKDKNFLKKMKMIKEKRELRSLKSKIKKVDVNIEKMKATYGEKKVNPELQKLTAELRDAQIKLNDYEEAFREKIRFSRLKIQAEKEKIQGVLLRFERRQDEYNATVNKEMMEGLQSLNDHLLRFFDGVDKLSVSEKTGKKLTSKIEILKKIATEKRGISHKILDGINCPDCPRQEHFQRQYTNDADFGKAKEPAPVIQGQTFFSLLSVPPTLQDKPEARADFRVVK